MARNSVWAWRSTVGSAVPPSGSPRTVNDFLTVHGVLHIDRCEGEPAVNGGGVAGPERHAHVDVVHEYRVTVEGGVDGVRRFQVFGPSGLVGDPHRGQVSVVPRST
jgi:hypothetical protein